MTFKCLFNNDVHNNFLIIIICNIVMVIWMLNSYIWYILKMLLSLSLIYILKYILVDNVLLLCMVKTYIKNNYKNLYFLKVF